MWTRAELKEKGKTAFKRNYWKAVVAALVSIAITGGTSVGSSNSDTSISEIWQLIQSGAAETGVSVAAIVGVLLAIVGIASIVGLLMWAFVKLPLTFGVKRFFLLNTREQADLKEIVSAFDKRYYFKIVGTQVLEDLLVVVGLCLLLIPGFILMYRYRMVRFVMADEGLSGAACLRRSAQLMKGQKWNAFVLDLSFLGWGMLSLFTCGILGVFYVNPYKEATDAELYRAIKAEQL